MGIGGLWKVLQDEGLVQRWSGADAGADGDGGGHAALVRQVADRAVAVDLSLWVMQGQEQHALGEFTPAQRVVKVALERALQYLRHGVLPVAVVEGEAGPEKLAAQRARFAARNGFAGGGTSAGAAAFSRLGEAAAAVLEQLGCPVIRAPGEAEVACGALCALGACDAVASSDSDALLHGAETVFPTLKLAVGQPAACEIARVDMAAVRAALGIASGGAAALALVAMLAGGDSSGSGVAGVGAVKALGAARALLAGAADDGAVLDAFAALAARPPDAALAALRHCTGCARCGCEGGRAGKIKHHTARNPCACCPPPPEAAGAPATGGKQQPPACAPAPAGAPCRCAWHARSEERLLERVAGRARDDAGFLAAARETLAAHERARAEAEAAVREQLRALGARPGQRLAWRHRPRVAGAHAAVRAAAGPPWGLPQVRAKLLPVLLEWDVRQGAGAAAGAVEFRPAAVQKVAGRGGDGVRYLVRWERTAADAERLGPLPYRAKKASPAKKTAARAAAAADGDGDDSDGGGGDGGDGASTQRWAPGGGGGADGAPLPLPRWDEAWLAEAGAAFRTVARDALARHWPRLEAEFQQRAAAKTPAARRGKGEGKGRAKSGPRPGDPPAGAMLRFLLPGAAAPAGATPAKADDCDGARRAGFGLAAAPPRLSPAKRGRDAGGGGGAELGAAPSPAPGATQRKPPSGGGAGQGQQQPRAERPSIRQFFTHLYADGPASSSERSPPPEQQQQQQQQQQVEVVDLLADTPPAGAAAPAASPAIDLTEAT